MTTKCALLLIALLSATACHRGPSGALDTGGGVSVGNGADGTEKTY